VKCPYCDYSVPAKRRSDITRYHIRRVHPEKLEDLEKDKKRLEAIRSDLARRARAQCLLCSHAATRAANLPRHYAEVHGYDRELAMDARAIDPEQPDGSLCPECGKHFANK